MSLLDFINETIIDERSEMTDGDEYCPKCEWDVYCPECEWEGLNTEGETEQDCESWEMSHITWTNFLCPKCGEITEDK